MCPNSYRPDLSPPRDRDPSKVTLHCCVLRDLVSDSIFAVGSTPPSFPQSTLDYPEHHVNKQLVESEGLLVHPVGVERTI